MKCLSQDCQNEAEIGAPWCDKCLDELGEEIEKHPIGAIPQIAMPLDEPLKITISSNEKGHGSQIDIDNSTFEYLEVGDIVAEGKDCVIERKKIDDFIGSSCSPHMWNQAKAMKDNYKRQVVIIVGHFPDDASHRNKKLIPHGYKAIANLVKRGITVLMVKNDAMLSTLSKSILEEAEHRDPSIPIKRVEKNGKHSVIQAIEGVGESKAKALLENYKSIKILCDIPLEVLSEFKVNNRKIGEKVAKRILETLN